LGKHSVIKSDAMMAEAHCAQCSDTRNIYIKTCDCSKKQVNQELASKPNSDKKELKNISAVDTNKQTEEPKLKAVKAVVYQVVRYVYFFYFNLPLISNLLRISLVLKDLFPFRKLV